jgi:hypothetical protein
MLRELETSFCGVHLVFQAWAKRPIRTTFNTSFSLAANLNEGVRSAVIMTPREPVVGVHGSGAVVVGDSFKVGARYVTEAAI